MEIDEDTHHSPVRPEIPPALVVLLVGTTHTATPHAQRAQWCQVGDPGAYAKIYDIAALSPTNVWLVGETLQDSSSSFAHWDGHHWNTVAGGGCAAVSLYALHALNASDIWAVGARTLPQAGAPGASHVAHIEHWDGSTW